jgi:hypothetical protein
MEPELHELIEKQSRRLQGLRQLNEAERQLALRMFALWLDAFGFARRNADPGKEAVAAQWVSDVVKAVVRLRPRGTPVA